MSKNKNVVARFKRVIDRNSARYKNLSKEAIEQALIDAFNTSLPAILGSDYQSFYAFWDINSELKIRVTRLTAITDDSRYYFFDLNGLSEHNIRLILKEFQSYLDYIENETQYKKIKSLKNGLVYGTVVRYTNNTATVEFYTDDGEIMYGFCDKRYLIESDRDMQTLREKDSMLFYVRNIRLYNNSRLHIQLSNRSIRIPELLLQKTLQENGYDLKDYPMKCIYRIPGQFSKIVVLNRIDKDIISLVKDKLYDETIRIIAIDNKIDINKFLHKIISFKQLGKQYDINIKNNPNKAIYNNTNTITSSIINKFKGA